MSAYYRASGHRLRRRLAAALTALAAGAALLVGLSFWATEHFVEEATLERRLLLELDGLIAAGVTPIELNRETAQLRYYRPKLGGKAIPPLLQALAPGEHHGIGLDGVDNTVLVRQLGAADRAVLVYHDSVAETRERWLAVAIALAVLLAGLGALWLARWLARQALMPLDTLVSALAQLNPEQRLQRLPAADASSELAVITQQFNSYMTRLDDLVERERAFAAAASHELRTPLAVIQGAAEVLVAQGHNSGPMQRILRAGHAAQRDLDALLWLSRSGTAPPAEYLALHERLVAICAEQVDVGQVEWQLGECQLTAPPGALAVIVCNLLRNALKAAPQPQGVRVVLNNRELRVEDRGPGIASELLPAVFNPGSKGRDGGTGMGLYIAATLARRLGWPLTLENRSEGGTLARLRFEAA